MFQTNRWSNFSQEQAPVGHGSGAALASTCRGEQEDQRIGSARHHGQLSKVYS
jgi:hypothetical protein